MLKRFVGIILFLLAVSLSFLAGLFVVIKNPQLSRVEDLPGGPVVLVVKNISGKVVGVQGSTMQIEAGGRRVSVKSGKSVQILGLEGAPKDQKIDVKESSLSAQTPASNITYSDFKLVPLGVSVQVQERLQENGIFLATMVFVIGEENK